MRRLFLSAALFAAMASCTPVPAFAQEPKCVSVEGDLEQIEIVKQYGARTVTFTSSDVPLVLEMLGAPEGVKADAIVMVSGDRTAALLFIEGDKVCRNIVIPLKAAQSIEQAIRGRSV